MTKKEEYMLRYSKERPPILLFLRAISVSRINSVRTPRRDN